MISNDVIIAYRKYAISQAGISIMDRGVGGTVSLGRILRLRPTESGSPLEPTSGCKNDERGEEAGAKPVALAAPEDYVDDVGDDPAEPVFNVLLAEHPLRCKG